MATVYHSAAAGIRRERLQVRGDDEREHDEDCYRDRDDHVGAVAARSGKNRQRRFRTVRCGGECIETERRHGRGRLKLLEMRFVLYGAIGR